MTALTFFDRAKMSVSGTPGAGAITLGSAATGCQSFASAGVTNGAIVSYVVEDGSNWEIGRGVYSTTGPTLTRTTVLQTSAGNTTPLTLTSAAIVYSTILAEDLAQVQSAPISALKYRYWRLVMSDVVYQPIGLAEIAFRATPGGAALVPASYSSPTPINGTNVLANAFDGLTTTGGAWLTTAYEAVVNIDYGVPVNVAEVALTANQNPGQQNAPDKVVVLASTDGINYAPVSAPLVPGTWSATQTQTFGFTDNQNGDTTGALGKHSFWRIFVHNTDTNDGIFGVAELEFRALPGGAQQASGGTAFATYVDGNPAANAFDGLSTTGYGNNTTHTFPFSLGYQFATPVAVTEVAMKTIDDNYWYPRTPTVFDVQYSDDSTTGLDGTWTTAWTVTSTPAWGRAYWRYFYAPYNPKTPPLGMSGLSDVSVVDSAANDGKVLTYNNAKGKWLASAIPPPALSALTDVAVTEGAGIDGQFLKWNNGTSKWVPAVPATSTGATVNATVPAYKRWRLTNFTCQTLNQAVSAAEVQFRATPGGAAQAPTSSTSAEIYSGQTASLAFDGNASTFWATQTANAPYNNLEAIYTTAVTVQEIAITARNDSYFYQSPVEFDLEASNDGINYVYIGHCRTASTYASGTTLTFPVPTLVQLGSVNTDTPYARGSDIVKPSVANFTLFQSGSNGTAVDTTRGMYMKLAATLADAQQVFLRKALPATPYTIKLCGMMNGLPAWYTQFGLAFSDSTNKHIVFNIGSASQTAILWRYDVGRYSALGTYSSDAPVATGGNVPSPMVPAWIKVQDDGTNMFFFGSTDGEHWFQLASLSRTAYVTPAYVGPILTIGTPQATGIDMGLHILSYSETAGVV